MIHVIENLYSWNTVYLVFIIGYSFYLFGIFPNNISGYFSFSYLFQYQNIKKAFHFLFWFNGILILKQSLKYVNSDLYTSQYSGLYNLITRNVNDFSNFSDIGIILLKISLFILIIYLIFNRNIILNYKYRFRDKSYLFYFTNFYWNKLFQVLILIFIEQSIHYAFRFMDHYYFVNKMYLLDWMTSKQSITLTSLTQGYYLAMLLSLYFTLVQFRYLIESPDFRGHYAFRYFIYSVITFFGVLITIYAVLNTIFNYLNCDSFGHLIKEELHSGLITLRVTSIIVFYRFYTYFSKKIYDGKFSVSKIILGKYNRLMGRISYSDYSSAYFAQLGFYILLIYFLWFFARNQVYILSASILNWGLFFIIDDWVIIHSYSDKFKKILKFDSSKVIGFNTGLSILLIISLVQYGNLYYFIIALSSILALMYIRYDNNHYLEKID